MKKYKSKSMKIECNIIFKDKKIKAKYKLMFKELKFDMGFDELGHQTFYIKGEGQII